MNKKKKNKLSIVLLIVGVVLIVTSFILLIYPQFSRTVVDNQTNSSIEQFNSDISPTTTPTEQQNTTQQYNSKKAKSDTKQTNPSQQYQQKQSKSLTKKEKIKTLSDLKRDIIKYNKTIYKEGQGKLNKKNYSKPSFDLKKYGFKNNIYGYINIPKINVKLPILLGCNDSTMALGAAHLSQTSIPFGGKNTNAVLAGHCGYGYSDYFRYLEKLKKGDMIVVKTPFNRLNYKVVNKKVVSPTITNDMLIHTNKDLLTLFTCHPYPSNKYRLFVSAARSSKNNS